MVLDSICLIRSRVTPYTLPISSSVFGWPSVRPNRIETTPASRSDSVSSTECSCSCSNVKLTASPGWMASESSIRSPNSLSPSSPSGVCSEIGSRPYFCTSMTFSGVMSSSAASSSGVGSLPRSCSICRCTRASLLITSTMCTGILIVRAWSAMARVMACLIQVQEQHPTAGVPLGQRHDKPEVGLKQVVLGAPAVLGDPLEVAAHVVGHRSRAVTQLLLGEQPSLDSLSEFDLLLGVQQGHLADLLEVVLDRIGGCARHGNLGGRQVFVVVTVDERLVLGLLTRDRRHADSGHGGRHRHHARHVAGGCGGVVGLLRLIGVVVGAFEIDLGYRLVADCFLGFQVGKVLQVDVQISHCCQIGFTVEIVDRGEVGVTVEVSCRANFRISVQISRFRQVHVTFQVTESGERTLAIRATYLAI